MTVIGDQIAIQKKMKPNGIDKKAFNDEIKISTQLYRTAKNLKTDLLLSRMITSKVN